MKQLGDRTRQAIAYARQNTKSFTDKYGQFLSIALRHFNMADQRPKHKNDKVFKAAHCKVHRRYIDLRDAIYNEATHHNIPG